MLTLTLARFIIFFFFCCNNSGSESAAIAAQWQDPAIVFEWPDLIYTAQIQLIERVFLFFI
jgi:hypothetical protein